jgi:hypothetical protein
MEITHFETFFFLYKLQRLTQFKQAESLQKLYFSNKLSDIDMQQ